MDFENPSVRNGIIAGIGASAITLLLYLVNERMVFSLSGWLTTILFIILMVRSVKEVKSGLEFMSFADALKPGFLTYVIGNLVYVIFYYVLLNFIDPGLVELQREIAVEAMEKLGSFLGEDTLETAMDEIEKRDFRFGLGTAALTYGWGLIFPGFIAAAIIAAVLKDRNPATA